MKQNSIKKLSEKEHLLLRPAMYISSVVKEKHFQYIHKDDGFVKSELNIVPGLVKILNELIDNSIDEFSRTNKQHANTINITMTNDKFSVHDNGRGIPNVIVDGMYQAELAWCHARAGSNFDEQGAIGVNGIGSFATNVFSKKFVGVSDDGNIKIKVETKNNLGSIKVTELKTSKPGVQVTTYPDFEKFGIVEFDEDHFKAIESRLFHLSMTYPKIKFKFNNNIIKTNTKNYFKMFNDNMDVFDYGNYSIGISHNISDTFETFSTMNGLLIPDGGTHIDVVTSEVTKRIREKLIRKYKEIKPAEIKNRLFVIMVMRDFTGAKFNSQTKEKLTNSEKEIREYLVNIDYDKIFNKVYKNEELIDSITDYYKIKAEMKNRADLKKLNKSKKKIKSEKYLPATKNKKVLFLCEGESALGGLMPSLGREEFGFYTLKGVPLNAYDSTAAKFTQNKELSELYIVIQNEDYDYIVTATDADADGAHIKGLLLGFMEKYLPELLSEKRFGELQTPVLIAMDSKTKTPQRWIYELGKAVKCNKSEYTKYMKGLGSYRSDVLKHIIKTDGIDNMIKLFSLDNKEVLDNWLSSSKADIRKEYIQNNEFDITAV